MDEINEYKKIALSNKDIYNILDGQTKVITYPELINYDSLNELFKPYGSFVILYLTKPTYGHWCCMVRHPDRIEFFDPYKDNLPDDELKHIPNNFRQSSGQKKPLLTKLLLDADMPIEYNNYAFQSHGSNIATCGRHCCVRIMLKNLLLDEYYKLLTKKAKNNNITYDQLVTYLTI